jgi:predicted acetyltransferase
MNELGLTLRELRVEDHEQAKAAEMELEADDFGFLLENYQPGIDWPAYVHRLVEIKNGINIDPGRVPATFMVAVVGENIVGRTSIRHALNPYLAKVGGHIGYGVRPAFRRKGYAKEILRQSLSYASTLGLDRLLLTCDDENVGSIKTIESCGGVLESIIEFEGGLKRRYWINQSVS